MKKTFVLIEVAGFHYQNSINIDQITLGDSITFEVEDDNQFDQNAVKILLAKNNNTYKIGYVMKGLNRSVKSWIDKGFKIDAHVERKNGTQDRPLVYIFTKVSK